MAEGQEFKPADDAADRAAVGHLAAAVREIAAAIEAAGAAGWGSNIRNDMTAAHVMLGAIVGDLA